MRAPAAGIDELIIPDFNMATLGHRTVNIRSLHARGRGGVPLTQHSLARLSGYCVRPPLEVSADIRFAEHSVRVLFLGHTGIGKKFAIQNLANAYLRDQGLDGGLRDIDAPAHIRISCLEDQLSATGGAADVRGFLDINNEHQAREMWERALDASVMELTDGPEGAHLLLSLHATYYRSGLTYSRADLDLIRSRLLLTCSSRSLTTYMTLLVP